MRKHLSFMPFEKGEFCLPRCLAPEECFVYRVADHSLYSHGLTPGLFAVVKPLRPRETYRDGEIVVICFNGAHLLKCARADRKGHLILEDDTGVCGPFPAGFVRIEARFVHACSGDTRTCRGKVSEEFREPLDVFADAGRVAVYRPRIAS